MQVEVWNVFEYYWLASQEFSRRLAKKAGEPDLDHHWTQENITLESLELGGLMDKLVTHRIGWQDRVCLSFGPLN